MTRPATSPTLIGSAVRIFDLSLGQMLWSRRSIFLALVVGGPVILAAAVRIITLVVPSSSFRINGAMIGGPSIFGMMNSARPA